MQDELFTGNTLSLELLKSVFDTALMEAAISEDGSRIVVRENIAVNVMVDMNEKDRIRLLSYYRFKEDSEPLARIECANHINNNYFMVCASVQDADLVFRYDLLVTGDLKKKALVLAVRRFADIPPIAVGAYGNKIVK